MIVALLAGIAFPYHLIPEKERKVRKVGSSYWGIYEGTEGDEPEDMRVIEIKNPARKEKVIAGSIMYVNGRGTSFRT